jgi:hypothetical protein
VKDRGILAFQKAGTSVYTSLRYDSSLDQFVPYELHWSKDILLILMNGLGILLPLCIATGVIFFATKVISRRWNRELVQLEKVH